MERGVRFFWLLVALLVGLSVFFGMNAEARRRAVQRGTGVTLVTGERVRLVKVVDGDSILVSNANGDRAAVRMPGIKSFSTKSDKDPTSRVGESAIEELRRRLDGADIRADVADPPLDRHGRTLARLFVDGQDVGASLVEAGLVIVYDVHPFSALYEYRSLEAEAREARRGLWGHSDAAARAQHLQRQWRERAR